MPPPRGAPTAGSCAAMMVVPSAIVHSAATSDRDMVVLRPSRGSGAGRRPLGGPDRCDCSCSGRLCPDFRTVHPGRTSGNGPRTPSAERCRKTQPRGVTLTRGRRTEMVDRLIRRDPQVRQVAADHDGHERRDRAGHEQGRAGAIRLGHPSDHGPAHGSAADEDEHVEPDDAATQVGHRGELHQRLGLGEEPQVGGADEHEQQGEEELLWCRGGKEHRAGQPPGGIPDGAEPQRSLATGGRAGHHPWRRGPPWR